MDITSVFDVVPVGRDECGSPIMGHNHYVLARDAQGNQWVHHHHMTDLVRLGRNEDGCDTFRVVDAETPIKRLAERISAAVAKGATLDLTHWNEIDPAYGSAAYQGLDGAGYFAAVEREHARGNGDFVPYC